MALKSLIPFPIFAPPNPTHHRPPTEIRFSRWNNANAEKFIRQQRTQKLIEDDLRRLKRFNSAEKIANVHENATTAANDPFRSTGTPSTPSRPSIPGKKSKYSKTPRPNHPAFRRYTKVVRIPTNVEKAETAVTVTDDGVSYVLPNAPFAFQYSYTETPKAKPLKLREPPVAPFGPSTMPRPWTGRKPLPPGKKRVEFDSFRLPPAGKKGVKPVQAPGPFLPGSGPKYVKSREEVLGEPLTKEEVVEMVMACKKTRRQLNMGRDGLTHNMLDNIHALWKRKRVCKIKCKGVCTVDMDNVRQQLEEKTGGKIIYSRGGIIYLFRGRNYNYRTRPQFPLMLWKPVTPVYPRLVQRAPEGLTVEEASEMRKKGRKLIPICKLGKNGVYCDLVKNVKEAFEACELVRINCEGMNGSDYRRIGAKLKDLVPCVLISFEREHILMWRGRDWKSSLPKLVDNSEASGISVAPHLEGQAVTISSISYSEGEGVTTLQTLSSNTSPICSEDVEVLEGEGTSMEADSETKNSEADGAISIDPRMEGQAVAVSIANSEGLTSLQTLSSITSPICSADVGLMRVGCTSMEADSEAKNSEADGAISIAPHFEGEEVTALSNPKSEGLTSIQTLRSSTSPICIEDLEVGGGEFTSTEAEDHIPEVNDTSSLVVCGSVSNTMNVYGSTAPFTVAGCGGDGSVPLTESHGSNITLHTTGFHNDEATTMSSGDDVSLESVGEPRNVQNTFPVVPITCNELQDSAETFQNVSDPTRLTSPWTEGVLVLWKEAIKTGSAVVLDDSSLDADIVYRRAVALAKSAPPGPVFRHRRKKVAVQKREEQRTEDLEAKEVMMVSERGRSDGKRSTYRRLKEIKEEYLNVAPQGSLRVDELAKLLA